MAYFWDVFVNGRLQYRTWMTVHEMKAGGYKYCRDKAGWTRPKSRSILRAAK